MGIAFFIDGANFSINWKSVAAPGQQMEFAELRPCVERQCKDFIREAYWFDATTSGSMNGYFRAIERAGGFRVKLYDFAYEPVFDELRRPIIDPTTGQQAQRRIQKGVDVGLAICLLDSYRRCRWDKLVLAASDADFAEPIRRLVEQHNVELTILGLPEKTSHALLPYATKHLDLRALAPQIARDLPPNSTMGYRSVRAVPTRSLAIIGQVSASQLPG